jgi:hypothetical protein
MPVILNNPYPHCKGKDHVSILNTSRFPHESIVTRRVSKND